MSFHLNAHFLSLKTCISMETGKASSNLCCMCTNLDPRYSTQLQIIGIQISIFCSQISRFGMKTSILDAHHYRKPKEKKSTYQHASYNFYAEQL